MITDWPIVRLGDVIALQRRWLTPEPDSSYGQIGVRSFGRGIFHKTPVLGAALGTKRVLRIEPGDLVLMNVFAWEGAVAVAGPSEAGMIGSHRYATYTADPTRCCAEFLALFFMTEAGRAILRRVSPGSAGRNRTLNLAQFAEQTLPLPPPPEQQRIVSKVELLALRVGEAQRLRASSASERIALVASAVAKMVGNVETAGKLGRVLTRPPKNGWSPHRDNVMGGTPVLSLGAVTGFRYRGSEFKLTSEPIAAASDYWLKPGDLLMTRSNTPELVGHVAIYDGSPARCVYPDLMMRLAVDRRIADARFIYWWLRSVPARDFVRSRAKGTSPSMVKISQAVVMDIPIPSLPTLSEQHRVVAELDAFEERLDELSVAQSKTDVELAAVLPAILDRAFKGEL